MASLYLEAKKKVSSYLATFHKLAFQKFTSFCAYNILMAGFANTLQAGFEIGANSRLEMNCGTVGR